MQGAIRAMSISTGHASAGGSGTSKALSNSMALLHAIPRSLLSLPAQAGNPVITAIVVATDAPLARGMTLTSAAPQAFAFAAAINSTIFAGGDRKSTRLNSSH